MYNFPWNAIETQREMGTNTPNYNKTILIVIIMPTVFEVNSLMKQVIYNWSVSFESLRLLFLMNKYDRRLYARTQVGRTPLS